MLEETVEVVAIEEGQLVLHAQRQSACGACEAQKGCGTSVLAKVVGQRPIEFRVPNTHQASVGDRLVIGVPEEGFVFGSFLIYIVPLLCMIASALLVDAWLDAGVALRELWVGVGGVLGIFLGLYFGRQNMEHTATRLTPVILRKTFGHGKLRPGDGERLHGE